MNVSGVQNNTFGANYSAIVTNKFGLHMTPSTAIAKLTKLAGKPIFFKTEDAFERDVNGSIINIMSLGATHGQKVHIKAADDYPKEILDSIIECISTDEKSLLQLISKLKAKFNIFH